MRLKQKKKIINNCNFKNRSGFIFLGTNFNFNPTSKKEILINKTKIFKKNNYYFELYNISNISTRKFLEKQFNLNENNILQIIDIYNNNLKLKIVVLKYNTELKGFTSNIYFDLLKRPNIKETKIFESIYFTNHDHNNYLSLKINSKENDVYIKLIDVYYFLIGYI